MTRAALPAFDGPRPQYYSLVMNQARILGQVRSLEVSDSIDSTRAGRVGSSIKKTLKKSKNPTFSIEIWVDSDWQEVAIALNASTLPTTGSTVKLNPSATGKKWRILHYNSEDTSATLQATTYMTDTVALEFSMSLDEDGEEVASISGEMADLYTVLA